MRSKENVTLSVPEKETNWLKLLLYGGAAVAGIIILRNLFDVSSDTTEAVVNVDEVGDIIAVAQKNGFKILFDALTACDLVETLQGEGPFTVFAPTDEAFAALPEGVLEKLLLPKNKDVLSKILKYHVVPGKVMASDITTSKVETVEGSSVSLKITSDKKVMVNKSTVITADVAASNGVIHVIDAVLMPSTVDIASMKNGFKNKMLIRKTK